MELLDSNLKMSATRVATSAHKIRNSFHLLGLHFLFFFRFTNIEKNIEKSDFDSIERIS
jgi:hypothetical protein